MSFRSTVIRVFPAMLLVVSLSVATLADTIRLKDGSIIKGKIVGFAGGKFTVSIGEGTRKRQMTFAAGEIETISFESTRDPASIVTASNRTVSSPRPAPNNPPPAVSE